MNDRNPMYRDEAIYAPDRVLIILTADLVDRIDAMLKRLDGLRPFDRGQAIADNLARNELTVALIQLRADLINRELERGGR